ncbi:hypothetical protein AAFF_G00290010 [Aldrovandia affinis]|uniref:Small ribosomal subunit protein mS39 n=1 Tax=Aldrovandia affinis TaxID=143900 RepID=A0AAD7R9K6_9TELE|nr:hypothetical protein AAFF_G00290010 [Aldrovandia affinis]
MAAPCVKAGLYIHTRNRLVLHKLEQVWLRRNFAASSTLSQHATASKPGSVEEIVIPKKKTWDKVAILKSLASTVSRDRTASDYMFQDDPYLTPKTTTEFRMYSLALESGRSAAKYVISSYPRFFQKDFAEPHIPCLMPETVEPQIEEVSEAALVERIRLRKVGVAVDLYDQLLQAGSAVSTGVTNDLLDLRGIWMRLRREKSVPLGRGARRRARTRRAECGGTTTTQRGIFRLMEERNERAYCALIRGMVKYGAHRKAFDTYTDMLNSRLTADVHTFNALIAAAPTVREYYSERWDLITEMLSSMEKQRVKPNLLTFNAVLKSLRRCGTLGRTQALQTLAEMKALSIEPSLATYFHLLGIFYKAGPSARSATKIIQEVIDEVSGKSFTVRDPDDVQFFIGAMKICLDLKDMELAYRLHRVLGEGHNWRLLGERYQQSMYYGRFFNLICMMENVDVVLKWYRDLIPSHFYPTSHGLRDLLQALDTDNRLDLLPQIWRDIKQLYHANKPELVEEVLALMSRDQHSAELQDSFADCALDVKKVFDQGDGGRTALQWTSSALSHTTTILLQAHRTREAWAMLQLFQRNNRVPAEALLEEFVSCARGSSEPQLAVELVQLANCFSLPATAQLAKRVEQEFQLNPEQKKTLSELEKHGDSRDSGSDSDSSGSDSDSSGSESDRGKE